MSVPVAEPNRRRPLWWRFFLLLVRPKTAKAVARVTLDGYLSQTGWLRSAVTGEITDARGNPIPWATLPFVAFIEPRLQQGWRVFEYGAGASTRFYAARVANVWAVDHDPHFVARLVPQLPPNAQVSIEPQGSAAYFSAIGRLPAPPQIVAIDGRDRNRCAGPALSHVANDGVIIFDDTDREEYATGLAEIADAGFRRLDFWGISPGVELNRCTTVFYRPTNVLGL